MRTWKSLSICTGLVALAATSALAQQTPTTVVSRTQSQILLDMPELVSGRETYQYFGWNTGYSLETSYAAVVSTSGDYPRAQIYMRQLAKGMLWTQSRLDENWIRSMGAFFRNVVVVLPDGPKAGTSYVTTLRFTANGAPCLGFTLRPIAHDRQGSATGNGPLSFDGVYCAAPGTAPSAIDEQAIMRGVYYRRESGIARAFEGDGSPIPARLRR